MRLQLVTAEFPSIPGGVGDYTLRLGQALRRSGHEIDVLTSADPRVAADDVVAVHPVVANWGPRGVAALARASRCLPADVVCFQYVPYLYDRWGVPFHLSGLVRALGGQRRPVVVVCHELFVFEGRLKHRLVGLAQQVALRFAQRHAAALVVTTGRRRDWLAARGFDVSRVRTIRVGSSIPRATASTSDAVASFSGRPFRVAMFGNLDVQRRSLNVVCAAIERLGSSRPADVVELRLIGTVTEQARRYLAARPLQGSGFRIATEGVLPAGEVTRRLSECDAAVLFETTGLGGLSSRSTACAAALAAGLPLVGNEGGDTDPIYRDGENVLLCPIDPAALAERLGRLRDDLSLRAHLRAGARDLVEKELSWERIASDYVSLLAPLVAAREAVS